MKDIKEMIHLKSHITSGCPYCRDFDISCDSEDYLEKKTNHLIQKHGFKLPHVGQETTNDSNGKPWHNTVSVVGTTNPPKKKTIPEILFYDTKK